MKASTKALVTAGALGLAGLGLLWFLQRRRTMSSPSEWSPFPGLTPPLVGGQPPPCTCPNGYIPFLQPDGSCRCSPVSIEILANLGGKCTSSRQCASGNCINGRCVSEMEVL